MDRWIDGWIKGHISSTQQVVGERKVNRDMSTNAEKESLEVPRSGTPTPPSVLGSAPIPTPPAGGKYMSWCYRCVLSSDISGLDSSA